MDSAQKSGRRYLATYGRPGLDGAISECAGYLTVLEDQGVLGPSTPDMFSRHYRFDSQWLQDQTSDVHREYFEKVFGKDTRLQDILKGWNLISGQGDIFLIRTEVLDEGRLQSQLPDMRRRFGGRSTLMNFTIYDYIETGSES